MKTVELSHLDYETLVDTHVHRRAAQWCEEQFGTRWEVIGNRTGQWTLFWAGRKAIGTYRFCFARKEDMMLFMLRWS